MRHRATKLVLQLCCILVTGVLFSNTVRHRIPQYQGAGISNAEEEYDEGFALDPEE